MKIRFFAFLLLTFISCFQLYSFDFKGASLGCDMKFINEITDEVIAEKKLFFGEKFFSNSTTLTKNISVDDINYQLEITIVPNPNQAGKIIENKTTFNFRRFGFYQQNIPVDPLKDYLYDGKDLHDGHLVILRCYCYYSLNSIFLFFM